MNKENDQERMLPEYDFSGGVRGKYAARFEGRAAELLTSAAELDEQAWLAHSLMAIQELEAQLVIYWSLVFGKDPGSAGRAVSALLEAFDEQPLRTLRRDLDEHTSVDDEFYRELSALLDDRSWLVHRSFHDLARSRLLSIRERSSRLSSRLASFLLERCLSKGMDRGQIESQSEEVVEAWAMGRNAA